MQHIYPDSESAAAAPTEVALKFSIIILNYKSEKLTHQCLKAVTRRISGEYSGEVIVVDNNSFSPLWHKLKERWEPIGIRFIDSPANLGYGQGNQLGIGQSKGQYLIILNPDVEIQEGAIETMIRYMDAHSDVGVAGPQLRYPDGTIQDSYRVFPTPSDLVIKRVAFLRRQKMFESRVKEYLMLDKDPGKTDEVDWLVGACLCIRRRAFQDVGGFDPRFFLFFEDTDLCRRMWDKNWRIVYLPPAQAIHHKEERLSGSDLLKAVRKKTFWIHVESGLKYFWKWR